MAGLFPFKLYKQEGPWQLFDSQGKYRFTPETGELDLGEDGDKARFFCEPIQGERLQIPAHAGKRAESIQITSSEIMREIQNEDASDGALFVLPSQLNGAEYTSHQKSSIVQMVEEYMRDNTGGPRGQLAAHPAAAQFVIDNAANDRQPQGINAVDELLKAINAVEEVRDILELRNGYLAVQDPRDEKKEDTVLAKMDEHLHTLRPLVMEDVPASGLTPTKAKRVKMSHKVGLVYASAVPVQSYMNKGPGAGRMEFQAKVAERILTAQYFGALQHAAKWAALKGMPKRRVFLMPLGGGVFNNPWEAIAGSMAKAMEMLDEKSAGLLEVHALAWNGNPAEEAKLKSLLRGS